MKRILLVEDNGSLSIDLVKKIEELEYSVERVYSYISALGVWEEDQGNYDCIILDLQINPEGLSLERINIYTPLYGMAFLDKICEGKSQEEILTLYKKTIIYSGFVKELDAFAQKNNRSLKGIKIVNKTDFSISELIKNIQRVCNK